MQAHPPILIQGDADLCEGDGDGVVNCDTADGSPSNPFVIEGWRIVAGSATCTGGMADVACPAVPPCDSHPAALVALCDVTVHVVVRHVTLIAAGTHAGGGGPEAVRLVGLTVVNSPHISLAGASIQAAGSAVYVYGVAAGASASLGIHSSALGPVDEGTAAGSYAVAPLVEARATGLRVVGSTIDASRHSAAIEIDDTSHRGDHSFVAMESTFVAAVATTIDLKDVRSVIVGNNFSADLPSLSPPALALPSGLADVGHTFIHLSRGGTHQIASNTFFGAGFYVRIGYDAAGVIELNRFSPLLQATTMLEPAVANTVGSECGVKVRYNDVNERRVTNDNPNCRLNARFNWWSDTGGAGLSPRDPRIDGPVDVEPRLAGPVATLPVVAIAEPRDPDHIRGRIELSGTAVSRDGSPLTAVEVTFTEDLWTGSVKALGDASWRLPLDLTGEPPGVLSTWVRACTSTGCGVPQRIDLRIVEPVAPPIALLAASPRALAPGQTVSLDASASYSPTASPIAAYRFTTGLGDSGPWQSSAFLNVTYDRPGTYTASVEVRDAAGIHNANQPQVLIRVRGVAEDGHSGAAVAGPSVLAALVVLGAAVAAVRRRPWR